MRATPAEVEKDVERIMTLARGASFILDSAEMVPRDVPVENMHAMMRKGHELAIG
jgi:uroporphyrinogen-III decarboxylase